MLIRWPLTWFRYVWNLSPDRKELILTFVIAISTAIYTFVFYQTERPRVSLRQVKVDHLDDKKDLGIQLEFLNSGRATATNVYVDVVIEKNTITRTLGSEALSADVKGPYAIQGGQTIRIQRGLVRQLTASDKEDIMKHRNGAVLIVRGQVLYSFGFWSYAPEMYCRAYVAWPDRSPDWDQFDLCTVAVPVQ